MLSEYIDSKSKVLILNNECRHKYEISPDNLLRGKGCPKCRYKSLSNARKNNTEDINLRIKKLLENNMNTLMVIKIVNPK